MIRVEIHDVFVLVVVRPDVVEQDADTAVDISSSLQELRAIDFKIRQAHARLRTLCAEETPRQRQARLHRCGEFEPFCSVRVHIHHMQEEELICLAKGFEMADRALRAVKGRQIPRGRDDAVVAAHRPAVHGVAARHRGGAVIAEILHALRERRHTERQLVTVLFAEHLRMRRITPCLDGGERGVGELRGGKMIVKDDAAREKLRDARHIFREPRAHDRPRETVHENVQHEFFAARAVSEEDGRAEDIGGGFVHMQRRLFAEPEIAERPLAEIGMIVDGFRLKR